MTINDGPNPFSVAQSLYRAKHGDMSVLIQRLRTGEHLSDQERNWLADLIEGKRKLPPNRPASLLTEQRDTEFVVAYLIQRDIRVCRNPAQLVAFKFGVSVTHLHRVHRKLREDETRYRRVCRRSARQVESFRKATAAADEIRRVRHEAARQLWADRRARRLSRHEQLGADLKSGD